MVEIIRDSLHVDKQSINPTIIFRARETLRADDLLLKVEGFVYSEDEMIIAHLVMVPRTNTTPLGVKRLYGQEDRREHFEEFQLMFTLDNKALDHVELVRQRNRKRDVVFKFDLYLSFFNHRILVGAFTSSGTGSAESRPLEVLYRRPGSTTTQTDILITDNENQFISFNVAKHDKIPYTVSSSDWINDYQEPFGIGKFMIIESPQLPVELTVGNLLNEDEKRFQERLDKAYHLLPQIELSLRKGEWDAVVKDCRIVLELFSKDVTQFIKKLVSHTTGMTEEKASDLTQTIDRLYAYTSDLHHPIDQGKVKEVYTGGKEDAYMMYMLVTSLINLLGTKFKKITASKQT